MSKKIQTNKKTTGFTFIKKKEGISQHVLNSNGLTVLHKRIPKTGVVTSNIVYKVGARDEQTGETGLAHMLEHMLFKPTLHDLKSKKKISSAMHFEQHTGCILNATTSNDRTNYFFSYPVEHFEVALQIEAERMMDVVLTDTEFLPERNNVLSEFDMYNGDPYAALHTQMGCAAFQSHPYGHETIGFREDIERYTPEKLNRFYKEYYRPDNATVIVTGDISIEQTLTHVKKYFKTLQNPTSLTQRHDIVEPKQEGVRKVTVAREASTNILALGVKHKAFPEQSWYETSVLFSVLAEGTESILHKKLVDTGLATCVDTFITPSSEVNLGIIFITLAPGQTHATIEKTAREIIKDTDTKSIASLLKKTIQSTLTDELFSRESSLRIAMDLTEYIAADAWDSYLQTESILKAITVKQLVNLRDTLFTEDQMTIGYFVGKK
ncbi:MAG: zinc protease [Acidimicrobiales bacterium]|jgi:zinc protease